MSTSDDAIIGTRLDGVIETWNAGATVSPVHDAAGAVVGASAIARDIGERDSLESALRLSEERYRALALASAQIVWTKNARGEVTGDWPTWRAFTGQPADEIAARGWINAVHPEDRERISRVWVRAFQTGSVYETEYRLRRSDGEYRHMLVRGVPVPDAAGRVREWIGSCADITERQRAGEELEKRVQERTAQLQAANRELEAFAYSVSHDLRAPLRAIHGFSRILMEECASQLSPEAKHYLEAVHGNALQMGELIDDLLTFSCLSRQPIEKPQIQPAEIVALALTELSHEIDPRVQLTVGDLPACEGDPALLKQVFVNLLSNALKYTGKRPQPRIDVGATPPQDGCAPVFYVRDNGVGFDMRYVHKLFGVFQRLHRAEEYQGTGIGLATVQRIVHRHGGRVWAESEIDKGAAFYFTLEAEA